MEPRIDPSGGFDVKFERCRRNSADELSAIGGGDEESGFAVSSALSVYFAVHSLFRDIPARRGTPATKRTAAHAVLSNLNCIGLNERADQGGEVYGCGGITKRRSTKE